MSVRTPTGPATVGRWEGPAASGTRTPRREAIFGLVTAAAVTAAVVLLAPATATAATPPRFSSPAVSPSGGADPYDAHFADVNGDGIDDVVSTDRTSPESLLVRTGDGHGSFAPPRAVLQLDSTGSLLVTDVNSDGRPDIVRARAGLQVRLATGPLQWAPPTDTPIVVAAHAVPSPAAGASSACRSSSASPASC